MSIFEFIMVMVSVILALALAQLLRALTEIPDSDMPCRVHSGWVGVIAFLVIQTWWAYWDFTRVEDWTFVGYLTVLSVPIAWFVLAHILVPTTRTRATDWQAHFAKVARSFYLILVLTMAVATLTTWAIIDAPLLHAYRAFQVALIVLLTIGIFVTNHKAHARLLIIYVTVLLTSQLVIRMNLGALAAG
jgi:hypothetical protein